MASTIARDAAAQQNASKAGIWLKRAKAAFLLPVVLMLILIRPDLFEADLD